MKAAKILIVDDELNMRLVLKAMLKKEGYEVVTAADGLEALKVLREEKIAVVATDLKMPRLDGMGLLDRIMQDDPSLPVIILTAYGTVANAVDALKKGAFDYLTKPFEQDELKTVILKAVKTRQISDRDLSAASGRGRSLPNRRAPAAAWPRSTRSSARSRPTMTTVLITGETGTGKELIARAIHRHSTRNEQPFIKINCAAIAENLVESELFGYEKGAFTGAVTTKPGKFELAHRGTLFLDEVGEIPREMQAKLLQAIQDQSFERVGGLKTDLGGRAPHRGDEPEPPAGGQGGKVPGGPLLPPQRLSHPHPAAPGADRGHPPPDRLFHREIQPETGQARSRGSTRRSGIVSSPIPGRGTSGSWNTSSNG